MSVTYEWRVEEIGPDFEGALIVGDYLFSTKADAEYASHRFKRARIVLVRALVGPAPRYTLEGYQRAYLLPDGSLPAEFDGGASAPPEFRLEACLGRRPSPRAARKNVYADVDLTAAGRERMSLQEQTVDLIKLFVDQEFPFSSDQCMEVVIKWQQKYGLKDCITTTVDYEFYPGIVAGYFDRWDSLIEDGGVRWLGDRLHNLFSSSDPQGLKNIEALDFPRMIMQRNPLDVKMLSGEHVTIKAILAAIPLRTGFKDSLRK
jgi:hypothetical protein